MDPSPTLSGQAQMLQKHCDTISPSAKNHPSSRRTPSFSSSSSLSSRSSLGSSCHPEDSPQSPATPLRFSGVPFSWEHLPGIPKKLQNQKKKESIKLLPLLPPPATTSTSKKYNSDDPTSWKKFYSGDQSFRKDPFFAALVECSKDDDNQESGTLRTGAKISQSISDRFGFIILNASCKSPCAGSESMVYLPKSRRQSSYRFLNHRSREE